MKKSTIIAALAVALAGVSVNSYAVDASANMDVGASITANCLITTTAIQFGAYDAIFANVSTDVTGNGAVNVTCTKDAATVITLGPGAHENGGPSVSAPVRRMIGSVSGFLAYQLYKDNGFAAIWGTDAANGKTNTGNGSEQIVTVYGKVPAGQILAPVGTYSDVVSATVIF